MEIRSPKSCSTLITENADICGPFKLSFFALMFISVTSYHNLHHLSDISHKAQSYLNFYANACPEKSAK